MKMMEKRLFKEPLFEDFSRRCVSAREGDVRTCSILRAQISFGTARMPRDDRSTLTASSLMTTACGGGAGAACLKREKMAPMLRSEATLSTLN
jgi:hypothetical protein